MDELEASVEDLQDVQLDRGSLPTLKSSLDEVRTALSQVTSDAEDAYGTEITAVEQAASSVSTSLRTAGGSPSAESLADVATAVQSLGTAVTTLQDSVQSTC